MEQYVVGSGFGPRQSACRAQVLNLYRGKELHKYRPILRLRGASEIRIPEQQQ